MPTFHPKHAGPIAIRSKETKVVLTEMMMNDVVLYQPSFHVSFHSPLHVVLHNGGGVISLHTPYIVPKP